MITDSPRTLSLRPVKTTDGNLSADFLEELQSLFHLNTFIETGTFMGDTVDIARQVFNQVESIELSKELHEKASARFKHYGNVRVHHGDSATHLPALLAESSGRGLLWLDAHYSEGVTAKGMKNTPILEELHAIKNTGRTDFVVLIDDLRLFQPVTQNLPENSSLHGYPTLIEIYRTLLDIDPNYNFYVFGDVALAYVEDTGINVSEVVRACTVSRVLDSAEIEIEDLLQAEQIIAHAKGAERHELLTLAERFTRDETLGLGQHYCLWQGLIQHQESDSRKAIQSFQRSITLGLDHWRVHYYLAQAALAAGEMELAEKEANVAQSMMSVKTVPSDSSIQAATMPPSHPTGPSTLDQLSNAGVWKRGEPLRLHLGCGEQYLDGYINVDYPQDAHNVMTVKADYFENLMELNFPKGSVDEIRLHHVFEHFDRATALALLIQWHEWLKIGGVLHIETPDLMGCARTLLSDVTAKVKSGITRHLAGDQSAPWAYHLDLWYPERFEETLSKMGFAPVEIKSWSWPHEPFLSNVNAVARKTQNLEREILLRSADDLLANSMVAPSETTTLATWKKSLRTALENDHSQAPSNIPQRIEENSPLSTSLPTLAKKVPQDYLYDFNQRDRDQWVIEKARSIPAGAKVLDVGAGTCPYRSLFSHCDYKAHDFEKYEGIKLGGKSQYGTIDYSSDIVSIPVPDASFDVILCTEVLEHVPEPIEALREMSRILKPGGRLLITAPLGSGLHQLPYHYYGGYTPEWYRTFGGKFGLGIQEITPNGGFFHLLAQECVRAAHLIPESELLNRKDTDFVRRLLADWLPQYLFQLEEHSLIDQFTIGYHVDAVKLKETETQIPSEGHPQTVIHSSKDNSTTDVATTSGVIFSKDRPLQLEATIASFKARCENAGSVKLNVLYTTSNEEMERHYQEIAEQYPDVAFVREFAFKNDLISLIQNSKHVLFLVDDCLFVKDFSIQHFIEPLSAEPTLIGASLRLGRNTTYCYSLDREQSIPQLMPLTNDLNIFEWPTEDCDFAYPLEVSSSIYRTELLLPLLAKLDYKNPNTLEAALSAVAPQLADIFSHLLCPNESIAFCAPINKVQNDFNNRAGTSDDSGPEVLAEKFSLGYRVDIEALHDFTPNACHQEISLPLKKNTDTPKVSIIIPCYNQAEFLEDSVASVVSQSFPNWECIIVNDGSTDHTTETAQRLIHKYASCTIRLVEQSNLGLAEARNTGIRESVGCYILPLDADDKLAPTFLEETIAILEQQPKIDIVYVDEQNFGLHDHIHVKAQSSLDTLKKGNVHDYCSLYRRSVWERVNGYSPAMFLGGEDWNFWLAAAKHGCRSYHLSRPLFLYRNREQSMVSMTLASINEVFAHIIFHHRDIFDLAHQHWAQEQLRNSGPENQARALDCLTKHPNNILLLEIVEAMRLNDNASSAAQHSSELIRPSRPLVSCIVPTMNRPEKLQRALQSLVSQSYDNWEAIVVNDAGEDVHELVSKIDPKGRIKYLCHSSNKGLSAARNTGIWASQGELLCYLDDDDRFLPEHLTTLVSALENSTAEFIYSEAIYLPENSPDGPRSRNERYSPYSGISFSKERLNIANFIPVNTWLHRRALIEKVGFFDPELTALEDWDMLLKMARVTDFEHLPKQTVEVYFSKNQSSADHMLTRERKNLPELYQKLYNRYPSNNENTEQQRKKLLRSWGIDYCPPQSNQSDNTLLQQALDATRLTGACLPTIAKVITTHRHPKLSVEDRTEFFYAIGNKILANLDNISDIKATDEQVKHAELSVALLSDALKEAPENDAYLELRKKLRVKINNIRYQDWIHNHALREIDGQLFAERMMLQWQKKPSFHLIMFVLTGEEPLLANSLESIAAQMYPTWRLSVIAETPSPDTLWNDTPALDWIHCAEMQDPHALLNEIIAIVEADWVALLRPGTTFEPHTLLQIGDYANLNNAWHCVYTDHDEFDTDGEKINPAFKPDINLDLLRALPYLGNTAFFRRKVLQSLGGVPALPGLETHDLALRIYETYGDEGIGHIADVLWHAAPAAALAIDERQLGQSVQEHLKRLGCQASVEPGYLPGTLRTVYEFAETPKVSLIVLSTNRPEFLESCVDSIFQKTDYTNFEVIISAPQSEDLEIETVTSRLETRYGDRLRFSSITTEYSISRLANAAARIARGTYLTFLDASSEIIQPQWLSRLLNHAARPEIAVVGPRIVYPESAQLKQTGLILGRDNAAGCAFDKTWSLKDRGYMDRAQVDQNYSAISSNCMMIATNLFKQAGGFTELTYDLHYADVDLCLKLTDLGYKHVWTPYATIVQHEQLEAREDDIENTQRQLKRIAQWQRERASLLKSWLPRLADDPNYNPNLELASTGFGVANGLPRNWDVNFHDRPRVLGIPLRGGSGEYRVIQPFDALSDAGLQQCEYNRLSTSRKRSISLTEISRLQPDTLVVQAAIDDMQLTLLEEVATYLPSMQRVCSLDDLITEIPEKSASYTNNKRHFRDARSRLRRLLNACNRLIVSTQPLAEAYAHLIDDIVVIPNRLAKARWTGLTSQRRFSTKPRVGWVGAQQHQGDLEIVFDVVKTLANDVEWVFMGMCPDEIKPYVHEFIDFVSMDRYPQTMASLNLDLAIAPLELHAFNEAKSNLRLLEYGAMGWPVICSDIYPYRTNHVPVTRVPNEPEAWIQAIRAALADPEALTTAGDKLRDWVFEHYLLEDHLQEWELALSSSDQSHRSVPASLQHSS